jgi:polysaccharide chain length determinant protein (PEP-CTERM system associated)
MSLHPEQLFKALLSEAFYHRKAIVAVFVVVNLVMLLLGLLWPQAFSSSASILLEDKRVIQPLMQGAAVTTDVADRGRLAREVIFGREIMNQILEYAGWMKNNPSLTEQEKIIEKLIKQTSIRNIGRDIIVIEYKDSDPERTFKTAQKYAELFISVSLGAKAAESQAAFDFIDKQTEEYHNKLIKAEEQLKEFRSANLDARPGSDIDISTRLNLLQTRIEQATQDLKEGEARKISLERQLSGEAEVASTLSREGQFRSRIAELQSRLETLRLSYHDTYPDITQIKHQIEDLNQAIAEDQQQRAAAKASGRVVLNEGIINNPLYQQLKQELSQTQTNIEMLNARITEAKRELGHELDRGRRVHGGEATLAELTRDYQVNRDIYQDLLKRRENARVSMNLDKEKQGLTIKIQEPAVFPRRPSGLRFFHFVVSGLLLGIALPLGLLYAKLRLDPRIRVEAVITDKRKLPLLAVVPHLWTPAETQAVRREIEWLSLAVSGTFLVVVLTTVLRVAKVIQL